MHEISRVARVAEPPNQRVGLFEFSSFVRLSYRCRASSMNGRWNDMRHRTSGDNDALRQDVGDVIRQRLGPRRDGDYLLTKKHIVSYY